MANVNSAATTNGNKKEPGAPASGLTLSSPGEATAPAAPPKPGEATAPAAPPKPGTPIPVGPSGRLVRIDN